ncbi:hypothetical protein, partial [Sinorhizobium fredii]|uniref:hypothetical protein n=1 Tax=Rhizobium fredii TaxID=380 RepID=UPI001AEBFAB9
FGGEPLAAAAARPGDFALTRCSIVAVGHGLSRVIFSIDLSHSRRAKLEDESFGFEFHTK